MPEICHLKARFVFIFIVVVVVVLVMVACVCGGGGKGLCVFNDFSFIFHLYLNIYYVLASGVVEASE